MNKKMKKQFLAVILVLSLAVVLWGCHNEKDSQPPTDTQEETTIKIEKPTYGNNGEWTNAGWASEILMTNEGDYVYVTNIKQEIEPVKGDKFYMTMTDFNIPEWQLVNLDNLIEGDYGDIHWVSEDPSIAQVVGNELVAIYAGSTKISGTSGDTTIHINVNVERGMKSFDVALNSQMITLYPNETFQLIATERNVSYSSADSSIAKVSADGVVTGVNPGNTTVTVNYDGKECVCKVIVAEDDDRYVKVDSDTKYTITKERVLLATDRTFIVLDAGVVIEDNLLENIEILLDKIETRTGYSFVGTNENIFNYNDCNRILIGVSADTMAHANDIGVMVSPYDITLEKCGANILTHELMHLVVNKNSVECGETIAEGYAEYFGIAVYENLPFCENYYNEEFNSLINFEIAFDGITLTEDNIEYYLINSPDEHPSSYFFVKYLVETYGEGKLKEIQSAITDEFKSRFGYANSSGVHADFSGEDMFAIVKSKTSSNVSKDFLQYFNKLEKQTEIKKYDLSGQTDVLYINFAGHRNGNYFDFEGGEVTLSGPLVIDFTEAIDYADKVFGRKIKEVKVKAEKASVTYYDQVRVKVEVEKPTTLKLLINTDDMFDSFE